jgi:peptidoglycan/LPS O-acetylase OafA/YrhL
VLLVVVFHLWPNRLPGGYVGVDAFFVISGFLITSHLMREVDRTGRVNLADFWARRIRRLLPAAYAVLLVSAVGVLVWVPRLMWQQFFGEILAATLYVENWALAISAVDYLAAENTPSPAQHYWTLSAEEQFYLLWPVLLLLALWLCRRGADKRTGSERSTHGFMFAVLAVVTAVSLAYSLWITSTNPTWAYFVTPARAWEFGAGALLAFAPAAATRLGHTVRALLGWAALAILLVCAVVLDESTPMPGMAAVVVVVATVVLIWVEAPQRFWSHARLLVLRPAEQLGDISYAMYLWHWPLIILLPHVTEHPLTRIDEVSVLLATVGASMLTKRFVEDPVRRARRFGLARPRVTFVWTVSAAVVVTTICVAPRVEVAREVERTEALAKKLATDTPRCFGAAARDPRTEGCPNPELEDLLVPTPAAAANDYPQYARCNEPMLDTPLRPCRFGDRDEVVPHVAVVGDSHARVLMTMVEEMVEAGQVTADMYVLGGCPWTTTPPDLGISTGRRCATFREKLLPLLDRDAQEYDAMLTTARLTTMLGSREQRVAGLREAWGRVTRRGVPVTVLRDNPQDIDPEQNPNFCLAEVPLDQTNDVCALDRDAKLDRWFDALSVAARRTPGARVVDLTRFLCDDEKCPVVIGGVNVYVDNNHMTVTYARTLAPYLYRELLATGVLPS